MNFAQPLTDVVPGVQGRVLTVLVRSGLPLTGKRVAEMAGASIEQTRQVLLRLVDAGLVDSRRAGQAVLYGANASHVLWPAVQQLVNAADQAVWSVKQRISQAIEDVLQPEDSTRVTAAVFGSVARGDSRPDSDVDVLLITPDHLDDAQVEALVVTTIRTVEASTGNDCNVYQTSRARFDELVQQQDPMVPSWTADATVFHGPDFRRRLRGASWDEPGTSRRRTTASEPQQHASTIT